MKRLAIAFIAAVIVVVGAIHLSAQNGLQGSQLFFDSTPGPLANCPAPATGHDKLCDVTGMGFAQSLNGGPYVAIGGSTTGVTSFNGRSGAVMPAPGDYSYSQLSNPPTSLSCTTSSQGNTGLTASGCGIK